MCFTSGQELLIEIIVLDGVGADDHVDLVGDIDVLFVVHGWQTAGWGLVEGEGSQMRIVDSKKNYKPWIFC